MSETNPQHRDPSDVKPSGQMIANYKDWLSQLARIDAFGETAGTKMERTEGNQPERRRYMDARIPKTRKGINLFAGLIKRLNLLDRC